MYLVTFTEEMPRRPLDPYVRKEDGKFVVDADSEAAAIKAFMDAAEFRTGRLVSISAVWVGVFSDWLDAAKEDFNYRAEHAHEVSTE